MSLETPLAPAAEGLACPALAQLADEAPGLYQRAAAQEFKKHMAEAIDALPEQEKVVLSLYYHEELTMYEIGQVLELTESRITQIRTKAMLHLRATWQNVTHDAYAPVGEPIQGCPPQAGGCGIATRDGHLMDTMGPATQDGS